MPYRTVTCHPPDLGRRDRNVQLGRTGDGGTHLEGLKSIVTRTVNSMARKLGKLKDSSGNIGGDFVREVTTSTKEPPVPFSRESGRMLQLQTCFKKDGRQRGDRTGFSLLTALAALSM